MGKNDKWHNIIFTDETDLFRNKVRRWHQSGVKPVRRLPKTQQKVFAWGGISRKNASICFTNTIDSQFYVNILQGSEYVSQQMEAATGQ